MMDLEEELRRADTVCRRGRQLLDARGRLPPEDVDGWLSELISSLEVLEEEVNNPDRSTVMRQPLLARISIMMTLRSCVEDATRSVIVGAGLEQQQPQLVRYQEIEAAFQRRLRTGVISNVGHLELTDFLNEAETVFIREIQRALHSENTVRVYVLLKSDYVKAGDVDPDTKSQHQKCGYFCNHRPSRVVL